VKHPVYTSYKWLNYSGEITFLRIIHLNRTVLLHLYFKVLVTLNVYVAYFALVLKSL